MSEDSKVIIEANPLTLIQQAIGQGIDPERLGKLMDLQERWERNKAIQAYSQAMNECQKEMPIVVKDRKNEHTRSKYATLEAVSHAIKPVYTGHGFSISFDEAECTVAESIKVTATLRHSGGHSEQFSTIIPLDGAGIKGNANKTATQGKGSTLTYARRYLTLMIFNIAVADEDLDGNSENTPIGEDQIGEISALMNRCRAAQVPVNVAKFCEMFGVNEITELPKSCFSAAKVMLNEKINKAKAAV